MVTKYVWWDEIEKTELVRREIRMPKALDDFCRELAKKHGVSVSGILVGLVVYAADASHHRTLRIERIPAVRVSDSKPSYETKQVPAPLPSPVAVKRWKIPKVS